MTLCSVLYTQKAEVNSVGCTLEISFLSIKINSIQMPGVAATKIIKTIKLDIKVTQLNYLQLAISAY